MSERLKDIGRPTAEPSPLHELHVDPALAERRRFASEQSAGLSGNAVRSAFWRTLLATDSSGAILDFGAGQGGLTNELVSSRLFSHVTGVDLMERPTELHTSASWVVADLNLPTPLASNTFDVLASVEVIEHLENPRATCREWFRLLKPGGHLIFTTPNNESVRALVALLVRGHYVAFSDSCYPAHITPLLAKDAIRIAQEAGFENISVSYTGSGGLPGMPHRRWQDTVSKRLTGRRFSDNLIVVAHKPSEDQ
jgi:2-polyprenyl-3-methyl-5-hydroxy-6-metoxy-1,4-benzoquinol methylase